MQSGGEKRQAVPIMMVLLIKRKGVLLGHVLLMS